MRMIFFCKFSTKKAKILIFRWKWLTRRNYIYSSSNLNWRNRVLHLEDFNHSNKEWSASAASPVWIYIRQFKCSCSILFRELPRAFSFWHLKKRQINLQHCVYRVQKAISKNMKHPYSFVLVYGVSSLIKLVPGSHHIGSIQQTSSTVPIWKLWTREEKTRPKATYDTHQQEKICKSVVDRIVWPTSCFITFVTLAEVETACSVDVYLGKHGTRSIRLPGHDVHGGATLHRRWTTSVSRLQTTYHFRSF